MTELSVHFTPDMPAAAVEVLSVDQRPLGQLWLEPNETQSLEVPSLDAVVQVFLPSGETVTLAEPGEAWREISREALIGSSSSRPASLARVLSPPPPRAPSNLSRVDSLDLAAPEVRRTSGGLKLGRGRSGQPPPSRPLAPYHATLSGGAAIGREVVGEGAERGLLFKPRTMREEPFDIVVRPDKRRAGPRLTVRVPGSLASALVTLAGSENDRVLRVRVRTWNESADTLGAYLARGDLRAASGMTTWAERAHHMLQDKVSDSNAATVGAYLLLRLRRFDLLRDWARNLANWFPSLADGCVIWAWQIVHRGGDTEEAAEYLEEAARRPLPVYTTGLRLLLDGLQLMGEAGEAPLDEVRKRVGFVLWGSPFTATLSGGASRIDPGPRIDVGYTTDRVAVDSGALASVSRRLDTLTVEFGDGTTYVYDNVPEAVYQEFLQAESKGAYYNKHIRDVYPSRHLP